MKAFRTFTSVLAIIAALLLCPPLFERTLSMGALLDREVAWLWIFAAVLVAAAIYSRFGRVAVEPFSFILFNFLILLSVEFAARATVVVLRPEAQHRLGSLAERTYDDLIPYAGHPFVQFTGVPGLRQPGTEGPFNNFGFAHAEDYVYAKPEGVVRIATIGGSTTANSYPPRMESLINQELGATVGTAEVMNFALPYWTTAHSLANFVLNVVDFEPDYVVIHHAWNDSKYQRLGEGFRGDYSHMLRPFESTPFIVDRYVIRASALYRYVKFKLAPPDWAYLDNAVSRDFVTPSTSGETDGFGRYRRNIETMIDLSILRGIRPVLTTMPHTLDVSKPAGQNMNRAMQIDEANTVLRDIATRYAGQIIFVDLDEIMTGNMEEVFVDLAHVSEAGRQFKAETIGAAILQDLREQ